MHALLLLLLLGPRSGAARPEVERCIADAQDGQAARDRGALIEARGRFRACAQKECPPAIRRDCASWLDAVERALPSIVVRARDADRRDVLEATVRVDGRVAASRLDGRPIAMDPGPHVVRVEAPAGAADVRVVVRQGEQNRPVDLQVGGPRAPLVVATAPPRPLSPPVPEPRPPGGRATAGWIALGVGAAGLAGFAALGLHARSEVEDMRKTCLGHCDPGRVEAAERAALLANLALGVGIAAAGTGTWLLWVTPGRDGVSGGVSIRY